MSLINLRSTWNHLRKNKLHTLLNIFGLAAGLLFFVHLIIYISYENGYDTHFKSYRQVYRINYDITQNGEKVLHSAKTPRRLFRVIKDEIPEVENSAISYVENVLVNYEGHLLIDQRDLWVEGDFTEIFDLEMIRGVAKLNNAWNCIISESKAFEIFGEEDPIGKVILVNEGMHHEITGIFKDLPTNSHIHFDYFMPIRTWVESGGIPNQEDFTGSGWWTYIKIKEGVDPQYIEKELEQVSTKYLTHLERQSRIGKFSLQPLDELHFSTDRDGELGTSTRKKTIDSLTFIAALILIVIWINYVNLSTALSRKRLNVFAVYRKLGASKFTLIKLSLIECSIINIAAVFLFLIFYFLTSGLFSKLIDTPISGGFINYQNIKILTTLIIITGVFITSLIASIPSLQVNPALLQQKKISRKSRSLWLVGIQFFISCFLIICSLMVIKQIHFMQNANLGVNLDQVVVIRGAASTHTDSLRREHFNAFREEALQIPEIKSGTASMNVPGQPVRFRRNNLSLPDMQSDLKREVTLGNIDDGFIETYGLKLLAGRNFEQPVRLDSAKVIITESTAKILGIDSPDKALGRQIRLGNNILTIKGVVNDFHHEGLKKPSEPIIFLHVHSFEFGYYSFLIGGNVQKAITQLQSVWPKHYPNDPLDYFFSNEYFNKQYNEEIRLSRVLSVFTVFAILVASLGLFGLISFLAQQRTKEIGLRKVNGASVTDIMLLLLSFFIRFELAAFLLACPLALIIINKWLQGYAYQTTVDWWIFIITGLIAFIISISSILSQSYLAATKNPAEALTYE
jgi:putative ABC transport system permease protein